MLNADMPSLYDITPFSLLDYPNEMSCIVWVAGCNMRCVYCHNPNIVFGKGEKEDDEVIAFLEKRIGKLSAVVFSGGEATLYAGLPALMRRVKAMGFKIKLDTNGSRPEVLRGLLAEGLVDYVAMDFKCPPEKTGALIGTSKLWEPFMQSLALLIEAASLIHTAVIPAKAGIQPVGSKLHSSEARCVTRAAQEKSLMPRGRAALDPAFQRDDDKGERFSNTPTHPLTFEIRTTVHPDWLDEKDLAWMIAFLDEAGYRGTYYIQNVASTGDKTIGNVAKPERALDLALIPSPKGFSLAYRNF